MSSPSSLPPAGIPTAGGNARYIAFALFLLLGIGAIVVWKFVLNRPEPPVVTNQSPSATAASGNATDSKLDDVPPPPPPVPDAGAPPVAVKPVAVAGGGGGGGCDTKCTGTAPGDLSSALQTRASAARRCYNSALANDSSLKGRVIIAVKIAPSGSVCSASVASTDMPAVAQCVAGVFRSGSFPAPHGGCVESLVPMNFVAAGGP